MGVQHTSHHLIDEVEIIELSPTSFRQGRGQRLMTGKEPLGHRQHLSHETSCEQRFCRFVTLPGDDVTHRGIPSHAAPRTATEPRAERAAGRTKFGCEIRLDPVQEIGDEINDDVVAQQHLGPRLGGHVLLHGPDEGFRLCQNRAIRQMGSGFGQDLLNLSTAINDEEPFGQAGSQDHAGHRCGESMQGTGRCDGPEDRHNRGVVGVRVVNAHANRLEGRRHWR